MKYFYIGVLVEESKRITKNFTEFSGNFLHAYKENKLSHSYMTHIFEFKGSTYTVTKLKGDISIYLGKVNILPDSSKLITEVYI